MRIGVVSDSHGHVENTRQAVRMLESLEVERLLHCGDIGTPEIVELLRPWHTDYVLGNCDYDQAGLASAISQAGGTFHDQFADLEIEGVRIALLHSHDRQKFRAVTDGDDFQLVCYGHSHIASIDRHGETLVLNPGALYRANPLHSIAVVELPALEASWSLPRQTLTRQAVDAIDRNRCRNLFGHVHEFHQIRIFRRVVVVRSQHRSGTEASGLEEQLGWQIGFAHFQRDLRATLAGELADELLRHLTANATMSSTIGHGKVQDMQPRFVKFINHEPQHPFAMLGNHANAIALTEAADEIFFKPGKLEALALDVEHFGHVAANHPADVNSQLLAVIGSHVGLLPCRPVSQLPCQSVTHSGSVPSNAPEGLSSAGVLLPVGTTTLLGSVLLAHSLRKLERFRRVEGERTKSPEMCQARNITSAEITAFEMHASGSPVFSVFTAIERLIIPFVPVASGWPFCRGLKGGLNLIGGQ